MAPRGIRHVIAAGLGALALLSCGTTGGNGPDPDHKQPGTRGSSGGFTTRYEEPSPADRAPASLLRSRRLVETTAASLNSLVAPDQQITVVGRSCDGEGSAYDPQTRRIELCYDDTAEDRALFQNAGRRRPGDDEAAAVATETVYHEAGHALIDLLELSLTDRQEEDAADQFAALMLLRSGPTGERQLRTAAEAYELSTTAPDTTDSRDEHAGNAQRAANHLCYLYGSAPARNKDLTATGRIPSPRATGCAREWTQVHAAWMTRLKPILRPREDISFGGLGGPLGGIVKPLAPNEVRVSFNRQALTPRSGPLSVTPLKGDS
ncbi:hypothetical protein A8W25_14385 [Streptomyces sp. ERV7]|uniref:DUF4344 domain-containing metallopeptidase n=1 Tax=Streptomyces sp. ERV7 TaxID=1322334 RepID=UPI0007F34DE2|nr:DUF4344 domain-containing metallopeptidase [Streptomyces sp. ERV7]OAR23702.1 hypothetical protein A8W25_14385 [Streptomyces sp. ERV7]